jgi:hypothetical protein
MVLLLLMLLSALAVLVGNAPLSESPARVLLRPGPLPRVLSVPVVSSSFIKEK